MRLAARLGFGPVHHGSEALRQVGPAVAGNEHKRNREGAKHQKPVAQEEAATRSNRH